MAGNKIQLKRTSVPGRLPSNTDIDVGELAINFADNRLFTKDGSNAVIDVHGQSLNTSAAVQFANVTANAITVNTISITTTSGNTISANSFIVLESYVERYSNTTVNTIVVTVNSKIINEHRYYGSGSGSCYILDGVQSPYITFVPGKTYKFDQSDASNSGHPLRFYLESSKTTAYTTNVTTSGTPGSAGAYTQIVVTEATPSILHYQCQPHDLMGNQIQVSGSPTFATVNALGTIAATTITGNLNWSYIQSKPDLKIDITGDATGNNTFTGLANGSISVTLANTAVTPGSYGNSSSIPVITVDSKGRITSATTNAVAGVTGFTYTSSNSTLVITTGAGTTFPATITAGNSSVQGLLQVIDSVTNTSISIAASANSVKQAYDLAVTANTAAGQAYTNAVAYAASNTYVNTTFAPLANPSLTGVVTVSGNLIVTGSTTYVNTNIFQVSDNIITLNADASGAPTENVGFEVNRGSSPYTYLIWDEGIDKWTFTNDGTTYFNIASNTDVNTAYSNAVAYAASNTYVNTQLGLKANLTGATFTGAVSGITTLAAGNTSITGFANVSSTLQVGANVILGTTTISANGGVGSAGQVLTSGAAGNVYWSTVATGGFANGQSISVANLVVTNIATLNAVSANGGLGTAGQVLTTNGSNVYWSTVSGGGSTNTFGTIVISGQTNVVADTTTDTLTLVAGSGMTITTDASTDTITFASSGSATNTFGTIAIAGQTSVVADTTTDTLTFVAGNNVTITTDVSTDTITFVANNTLFTLSTSSNNSSANISLTGTGLTANTVKVIGAGGVNVNSNGSVITIDGTGVSGGGGGGNSFGTVTVSGQSDVIADQANDVLTLVAGSGMTITTSPGGDTITFTSSGGGSGTGTGTAFIAARDNFTANGTQTVFTLSTNATANSILVAVDGLIQFHTEDYDVSGTTLTFSPAPANNELIEVLHISGATNYLFQQYAAIDSFSGNGSNTGFTLTRSANTSTAQVYLDGLLQDPNNDYTFSNTTLTFTTAPLTSEAILVYHTESSSGNPHLTSISGIDTFAGDGTTTVFTLTGSANSSTSFITVNGLVQRYTTDYTLSGTTLTFVDAPPNGSAVQGLRLTGSLGVTYKTIQVSGQSDIVADQADDILTFANGAGIVITTNAGTDTLTIARAAITKQSLTGNGSNTIFTLSTSTTEDDILVHVDGLYFHPTDDYTVSGTTITFTAAPINSAEIRIRYMR